MSTHGVEHGSRLMSRRVGLHTPTALSNIVMSAAGPSRQMSRGLGPVITMVAGASVTVDAAGPGFLAEFGPAPGALGAKAIPAVASGGRRCRLKLVVDGVSASAVGSITAAASAPGAILSLTSAISAAHLILRAVVFGHARAIAGLLLIPLIRQISVTPNGGRTAAVLTITSAINRSITLAARNVARCM